MAYQMAATAVTLNDL